MDYSTAALIAAPAATLTSTLLRGFQNKAVAANDKRQAFVVGSIMNAADMLVIASVASHASIAVVALAALGAGTGWVSGMFMHDKLNARKRAELKARKRDKERRRIVKVVRNMGHQEGA